MSASGPPVSSNQANLISYRVMHNQHRKCARVCLSTNCLFIVSSRYVGSGPCSRITRFQCFCLNWLVCMSLSCHSFVKLYFKILRAANLSLIYNVCSCLWAECPISSVHISILNYKIKIKTAPRRNEKQLNKMMSFRVPHSRNSFVTVLAMFLLMTWKS